MPLILRLPSAKPLTQTQNSATPQPSSSSKSASRSRRGPPISVPANRSPSEIPEEPKRTIRLTVKQPPSRLRELTAGTPAATRAIPSRSSKNKHSIVEDASDNDEDEGDDDEDMDDDVGEDMDEDEEDEEEDEDEEMIDATDSAPTKPAIKISAPTTRKPSPDAVLKQSGPHLKSVEDKEISGMDEDDDDLSNLDDEGDDASSSASGDAADIIRANTLAQNDLNDDDDDSDIEGDGIPDSSKLTRRQRAASPTGLMALSNEAQKKKFFTSEEITMRRVEMARRRKDLSDKRNEEEKSDTLRRLLEKPAAPKRRSRAQVLADNEREEFGLNRGSPASGMDREDDIPANRLYVRTIMSADGSRIGVPQDWLEAPVGKPFQGQMQKQVGDIGPRRMVEVVQ